MKPVIVIGEHGHIDSSDHQWVVEHGIGDAPKDSVVRFYFDADTYADIEFEKDFNGKGCLQVRVMSRKAPSLIVQPLSGNAILVVPGM